MLFIGVRLPGKNKVIFSLSDIKRINPLTQIEFRLHAHIVRFVCADLAETIMYAETVNAKNIRRIFELLDFLFRLLLWQKDQSTWWSLCFFCMKY